MHMYVHVCLHEFNFVRSRSHEICTSERCQNRTATREEDGNLDSHCTALPALTLQVCIVILISGNEKEEGNLNPRSRERERGGGRTRQMAASKSMSHVDERADEQKSDFEVLQEHFLRQLREQLYLTRLVDPKLFLLPGSC